MVVGLVLRNIPSQVSVAVKIRAFEGDAVLYRQIALHFSALIGCKHPAENNKLRGISPDGSITEERGREIRTETARGGRGSDE